MRPTPSTGGNKTIAKINGSTYVSVLLTQRLYKFGSGTSHIKTHTSATLTVAGSRSRQFSLISLCLTVVLFLWQNESI
jgi:hypothetical protein